MTLLLTTIEQAAINALCRWLTSSLGPDVVVSDSWPDPDAMLPKLAVTVLTAGKATETPFQPSLDGHENIHDGVSARCATDAVTDLDSGLDALNTARASYEAHRQSLAAHDSADATNILTAPAATDLPSGILLANDFVATAIAHLSAVAHEHPDGALAFRQMERLDAGDLDGFLARVTAIVAALNAHFAARIYLWRIADVDQPAQLDVWATSDAGRKDLVARLTQALHAGAGESAGAEDAEPVGQDLLLTLSDGWTGWAVADFDAPEIRDTPETVKRSEYRATYAGSLAVWRLLRAQSPRITRASLAGPRLTVTASLDSAGTPSTVFSTTPS